MVNISDNLQLFNEFCLIKLVDYRSDELEKKVEKHNNVVERTIVLERDMKTAFNKIDELRRNYARVFHMGNVGYLRRREVGNGGGYAVMQRDFVY